MENHRIEKLNQTFKDYSLEEIRFSDMYGIAQVKFPFFVIKNSCKSITIRIFSTIME